MSILVYYYFLYASVFNIFLTLLLQVCRLIEELCFELNLSDKTPSQSFCQFIFFVFALAVSFTVYLVTVCYWCVVRGSRTPVFSMSYNHAENCVLLCIVSTSSFCIVYYNSVNVVRSFHDRSQCPFCSQTLRKPQSFLDQSDRI